MRDWLAYRRQITPSQPAIVVPDRDSSYSFAELDTFVTRYAKRLNSVNIDPQDRVCILATDRKAIVEMVYALKRLGIVMVPLNPNEQSTALNTKIGTIQPDLIICDSETESKVDGLSYNGNVLTIDDQSSVYQSISSLSSQSVTPYNWGMDDELLVMFTSGTTGSPKAVRLTYGNVFISTLASAFRLGHRNGDRWLCCLSFYHMGGIVIPLRTILYGIPVVLQDSFDPDETLTHIKSTNTTGISLVPTMLHKLIESNQSDILSSLRFILLGGAPASRELIETCIDRDISVYPTYGMTETASQIATATPSQLVDTPETVGKPLLMADITIVDSDGNPVQATQNGEIVVQGPTVTPGYIGDQQDMWCEYGLRTGDIGYQDESGNLFILNRKDDIINTGGEKVHPGEVKEVLESHRLIDQAAVIGIPDDEWGEIVGALIVPMTASKITKEDVEIYCEENLAAYKKPRCIAFNAHLPRTESGTIDRQAVKSLLQ
ncbi:MAG: o-succinylbenzoate--CoA ligase [Halobacteriaceae archaeon]